MFSFFILCDDTKKVGSFLNLIMTKSNKKENPSCFVTKIDLSLSEKLQNDLREFGYTFSKPPYTVFSAKTKGISLTLFESGKLMVQGKNMSELIEFYLEPDILKSFAFTNPEAYVDTKPHIGSDEAGKGDFFGPLCIAGVYADAEGIKTLAKMRIKDSKKLSDDKVLTLSKKIKENFAHHVIRINPPKYNELYGKFQNLNKLLAWAHAAIVDNMVQQSGCNNALIDQFGPKPTIDSAVRKKQPQIELELRHRAEEDPVVAAAAILARASFLNAIDDIGKQVGHKIPKGASSQVRQMAQKLYKELGPEPLANICKRHFVIFDELGRA